MPGVERRDENRVVLEELACLPAHLRDPVQLHYLQGLKVAEIARLLDAPESTIKTRLQRGRAVLRSRLHPRLSCVVFALPWLLEDVTRSGIAGAAPPTGAGR